MALVSSWGSQITCASGGACIGSTGKSQPPPLPDPVGQRAQITFAVAERLKIPVVGFVAAQPFPRDVGRGHVGDVRIAFR